MTFLLLRQRWFRYIPNGVRRIAPVGTEGACSQTSTEEDRVAHHQTRTNARFRHPAHALRRLWRPWLLGLVALAVAVPVALAARPARIAPGQKIDLKVLLLSADGTQPGFEAWKAALDREGVPYDTFKAFTGQTRTGPPITDASLADYGANHARYSAIILETGDLGHTVNNPAGPRASSPPSATPSGRRSPSSSGRSGSG